MNKKIVILLSVLALLMAGLYSCKTDTALSTIEYISRIDVIATDQTNLTADTFAYINFREAEGGPATLIDTIRLHTGRTYAIQLRILDEASNPILDLTDSIRHMGDTHLVVYTIDPVSGLIKSSIQDKDSHGLPLGLQSTWQTGDSATGYLRLILYHQPMGKNGTPTPGNVDFEADYPVVVQ
ncbi:MAG: hypothetical protein JST90_00790 [Bacteroidetes bacterium]|nr:hypothetical protein [Bacteroidota bacterium]